MMTQDALSLEQEATDLRNKGRGLEAIKTYEKAKELYEKNGDLTRAAGMQYMIGVCYKIENDIDKAMPAYESAIADYKKVGDALGPGRVQRDIGIMFEYYDRLDEARTHLLQSKSELESLPEGSPNPTVNELPTRDAELGITLAKLGLLSIRANKLEEAEKYLIDGLALIRKAGHPFYEMTALMHMGSLYFATKHYGRMIANLEAALGLIYEHDMDRVQDRRLAQIYGLLAHGYLKHDNAASAKHFAKKSLDIIDGLSVDAQKPLRKDVQAEALLKIVT